MGSPLGRAFSFVRGHWILSSAAVLFLLWWGVPTARKEYYDAKVREMCKHDGGIKVYEQVQLPPENIDQWGGVRIPSGVRAKPSDDFVMNWDTKYYERTKSISGLELWRDHLSIVRRSDSKILGEAISYARRGGDPIQPWESSWFNCPESAGDQDLIRKVFIP
ncbi:MAG: hypothetical protein ABI569_01535 [Casimicrobiaceae bacterium]